MAALPGRSDRRGGGGGGGVRHGGGGRHGGAAAGVVVPLRLAVPEGPAEGQQEVGVVGEVDHVGEVVVVVAAAVAEVGAVGVGVGGRGGEAAELRHEGAGKQLGHDGVMHDQGSQRGKRLRRTLNTRKKTKFR